MRAYQEAAFRVAYLIVRNEEDARDSAQEAFVRAHGALKRFDRREAFRPWLLRIVTNVALNSARANRRRTAMGERYSQTLDPAAAAPSVEERAEAAETARRVWQAVGELDGQDQALLYLRYFVGATELETAAAIGRPVGTVKSRLHRVLRRLRGVVETQYPDLLRDVAANERADAP